VCKYFAAVCGEADLSTVVWECATTSIRQRKSNNRNSVPSEL